MEYLVLKGAVGGNIVSNGVSLEHTSVVILLCGSKVPKKSNTCRRSAMKHVKRTYTTDCILRCRDCPP